MPNKDGNGYHSEAYLSWFDKHGHARPEHAEHGSADDISKNLKSVNARNWRMRGAGLLVADTDMGELVQMIPTDYVCHGTDDEGHPVLAKVVMQ